jgi:hypothetical protein
MLTKKSNSNRIGDFSVETAVFHIAKNSPDKAVNLQTGEVRNVIELKPDDTWDKVTLRDENSPISG